MLLISPDSLWRTRWEVVVMAAGRNQRQLLRAHKYSHSQGLSPTCGVEHQRCCEPAVRPEGPVRGREQRLKRLQSSDIWISSSEKGDESRR